MLADTVAVNEDGAEVLTDKCTKKYLDVSYYLQVRLSHMLLLLSLLPLLPLLVLVEIIILTLVVAGRGQRRREGQEEQRQQQTSGTPQSTRKTREKRHKQQQHSLIIEGREQTKGCKDKSKYFGKEIERDDYRSCR